MNSSRRFLASCGLVGLMLSVSCTPPPAAMPHAAPTSTPASASVSTPVGASCADELAAEDLVHKGEQVERIDPDQALALYEQAAALAPKNARIQYRIGQVHQKKGDWDKAAASYGRATNLDPSFANYWSSYGYSLDRIAKRENKGWEDARKALEKCIEIDPNYADCHQGLGTVFLRMDDERKALESYTKAIQIEPTRLERYFPLSDLYLELDFVEEAESVLKQAKRFARPGDRALFAVHLLLANIYQMRGDIAQSIAELEAAKVEVAGEGREAVLVLFYLGNDYASMKPPRRQEAIANLKAFSQRACTESERVKFETECKLTKWTFIRLGETGP